MTTTEPLHSWYSIDAGSATELELEPGRYVLSEGCTVARLRRDPPPQRSDYDVPDIEWEAIKDRGPAEHLTPLKIARDGGFLVRPGRGGLHRIVRTAGLSSLMQLA